MLHLSNQYCRQIKLWWQHTHVDNLLHNLSFILPSVNNVLTTTFIVITCKLTSTDTCINCSGGCTYHLEIITLWSNVLIGLNNDQLALKSARCCAAALHK